MNVQSNYFENKEVLTSSTTFHLLDGLGYITAIYYYLQYLKASTRFNGKVLLQGNRGQLYYFREFLKSTLQNFESTRW